MVYQYLNQFFFNKTSPQNAKMNRFMVLESQNRLSTSQNQRLLVRKALPQTTVNVGYEGKFSCVLVTDANL